MFLPGRFIVFPYNDCNNRNPNNPRTIEQCEVTATVCDGVAEVRKLTVVNMRLFAIRTIRNVLVIFQFSSVIAVWKSDIKLLSDVINEQHNDSDVSSDVHELNGKEALTSVPYVELHQPEWTSYQTQKSSLWSSNDPNEEYSENDFYQAIRPGSHQLPPFTSAYWIPGLQGTYQQAYQMQPLIQQQFQQSMKHFYPADQLKHVWNWQQMSHSITGQQVPYTWQQHPQVQYPAWVKYLQPYSPPYHFQYPIWGTQGQSPQYDGKPNRPGHLEEWEREYYSWEVTMAGAEEVMKKLNKLISAVRPIRQALPPSLRYQLFQQAYQLLSRVAALSVLLISHRNNSDLDEPLDEFLHKMEEKSYQLKTMLIELQSFGSDSIPVATPPDSLPPLYHPQWELSSVSPSIDLLSQDPEASQAGYSHFGR